MLRQCSHVFSWPLRAPDGRYYRLCASCGAKYEFDWQQMRGIGEGVPQPSRPPFRQPNARNLAEARPLQLLPSRESPIRVFAENLIEVFQSRPRLAVGYRPSTLWRDVFVPTGAPWRYFWRSLVCHAITLAVIAALLRPSKLVERRLAFSQNSQITYYVKSPTFPAREARPAFSSSRSAARTQIRHPAAIRVAPGRRTANVNAPQVKLPRTGGSTRIAGLGSSIVAPALPSAALSQLHLRGAPGGVPVAPVGPAPEMQGNLRPSLSLSQGPVIGPPSNLAGIPPQRRGMSPESAVVAPPPSVQGLKRSANAVTIGNSTVVAPAPQVAGVGRDPNGRGGTAPLSLGGSSEIVAPPPQITGTFSKREGGLPQSIAVAPAPSLQGLHSTPTTSTGGNLGAGYTNVVPPVPQISALGGGSGDQRGALSISSEGASVIPPAPSLQGSGTAAGTGAGYSGLRPALPIAAAPSVAPASSSQGVDSSSSEAGPRTQTPDPEFVDNSPAGSVQEFSLHLVGLASALPTSSYFSNYEVFIAERRLNKPKSQLIKLVYMFLPYQRRLSDFGITNLQNLKLRVRRDPSCDETLLAMMWPDGESRPKSPDLSSADSKPADSSKMLPCYRTSADDYRRALSKTRQ